MYFVRPDLHVRAGPSGSARGACISRRDAELLCGNRGLSAGAPAAKGGVA